MLFYQKRVLYALSPLLLVVSFINCHAAARTAVRNLIPAPAARMKAYQHQLMHSLANKVTPPPILLMMRTINGVPKKSRHHALRLLQASLQLAAKITTIHNQHRQEQPFADTRLDLISYAWGTSSIPGLLELALQVATGGGKVNIILGDHVKDKDLSSQRPFFIHQGQPLTLAQTLQLLHEHGVHIKLHSSTAFIGQICHMKEILFKSPICQLFHTGSNNITPSGFTGNAHQQVTSSSTTCTGNHESGLICLQVLPPGTEQREHLQEIDFCFDETSRLFCRFINNGFCQVHGRRCTLSNYKPIAAT